MLRFLLKGGIFAAVLYAGVTLGFPYYQYMMMQRAAEEAADLGVTQLKAGRAGPAGGAVRGEVATAVTDLMQAWANRVGLELPAERIQVSQEYDLFRVRTNWEVEARLPGYVHQFRFRVEAKRIVVR